MKITRVSCTQFAGVQERSIELTDGINVIYGKNESGKSTLVNLISRTLFQSAKLDKRKNKDFIESFFPAAAKGSGLVGDFADGTVKIEGKDGAYTLSKEWGADPRSVLSTPGGSIRDQAKIDDILKTVLVYGEGVYSDLLLTSQRNADVSLQTLLDAAKKTDAKQEITNAVSQAFAESDGISLDAMEQAITAKIEEIAGKHWDAERDAPVRKSGRWSSGLGEILAAYYAREDANTVLREIADLEADADRAAADYVEKDAAVTDAEEAFHQFNAYASRLAVHGERKKAVSRLDEELRKYTGVLAQWPELVRHVQTAKQLRQELANRQTLDLYASAKKLHDHLAEKTDEAARLSCPEDAEISQAKKAQRRIDTLSNQLCGMNLSAAVTMQDGHCVEFQSLRTGEALDVSGNMPITEAVRIVVPGVMEMVLTPANVDFAAITDEITRQKETVDSIFAKYQADSLEKLEELANRYRSIQSEISAASVKLNAALAGSSYETLEAQAKAVDPQPRELTAIQAEIRELCGAMEVSQYITSRETTISAYARDYVSVEQLESKASDIRSELAQVRCEVASMDDIPEVYRSIEVPEAHLNELQNILRQKRQQRETALTAKTAASGRLEGYQEKLTDDPREAAEKAEQAFAETKALLAHWQHIAQVFAELKENLNNNPMQDIADNFARYLGVISGDKVSSQFPDAEKLNIQIFSSNRLLDFEKLSEGTKETVSLAFRLAVLDHLFPEGGGIAVLDDPFANMDAERTAQSIALVKDCAQRHQVIFLTCKEAYLDQFGGNSVRL